MNLEKLKKILRSDEGLRLKRYRCSAGVLTIGYGHAHGHVPKTCTLEQAETWLQEDIDQAIIDARLLVPGLDALDEDRQIVLVCMAFQLGYWRLKGFKRFLAAVNAGLFELAALEMLDSKWHREDSPERAERLAEMMRQA